MIKEGAPPATNPKLAEHERYVEANRPAKSKEVDGWKDCSRICLFGINLLFLGLGAVMIGIGVYALNARTTEFAGRNTIMTVIILGAIVAGIAFLGCCGAAFKSSWLLCFYALILIAVIIAQVVVASMLLADSNNADRWLVDGWKKAKNDVRVDVQNQVDCCGLHEFNDTYAGQPCPEHVTNTSATCFEKLKQEFRDSSMMLGIMVVVFAVIELLGVFFALYLRSSNKYEFKQGP